MTPSPGAPDPIAIAARAHEPDRYLAALLAPADRQRDLVTLAAFAGDVARIPATVTEPMIGAIRLQWWRDALALPDGEMTGHPIADAIGDVQRRSRLDPALLTGFVDAQEACLDTSPPADDAALSAYFDATDGALFAAAQNILADERRVSGDGLMHAAGQAYGRARMLAEFAALIAEGRTLVPGSRLRAAGLSLDSLPRQAPWPLGLVALLDEIGDDAAMQLNVARQHLAGLARRDRVALLPLAVVPALLARGQTQRRRGDLSIVDVMPLSRVSRLAWTFLSGRL